jgi:hypothetical protein
MKCFLPVLLLFLVESSSARQPGYCTRITGDELKYCLALLNSSKDACSEIASEEKKYTCHARLRYDEDICGVIDDKAGQTRCLELVRKDERLRKRYAYSLSTRYHQSGETRVVFDSK